MSDTYNSPRRVTQSRPLLAILLFAAVYVAAMVVMFAPKDTFGVQTGSSLTAPSD